MKAASLALADMQLVVAREYGFDSWPRLKAHVESSKIDPNDFVSRFLEAAGGPGDASIYASVSLDRPNALLSDHPEVADANVYTAAALGNVAAVRRILSDNPAFATEKGGLRDWDALTYCCFSRYFRLETERADDFVQVVNLLLEHGADPSTGFHDESHLPSPSLEPVLYGAICANHVGVAKALIDGGADVNHNEIGYHSPEIHDSEIMKAVVESGHANEWTLATMLLRKIDFHDYDGIAWLLDHGASPNELNSWGKTALHQVVLRRNPLETAELLMDRGADPLIEMPDGKSAVAIAARMGRVDLLELFVRRGVSTELEGIDRFLAACARADGATARAILSHDPELVANLKPEDKSVFAEVAGSGNTEAVRLMLDLGFDIAHPGDWGNTGLHLSIWRGAHDTSKLLIERGAPIEQTNDAGVTPLLHAVRAAIGGDWDASRTTETVAALLEAGADVRSVKPFPTSSDEVNDLLRQYGR